MGTDEQGGEEDEHREGRWPGWSDVCMAMSAGSWDSRAEPSRREVMTLPRSLPFKNFALNLI